MTDLIALLDKGREQNPGAGTEELADWLLNQAVTLGVGVLYQAVLTWVQTEERSRVRAAEREAFTRNQDTQEDGPDETRNPTLTRPFPYVNPAQAAMKKLLSERCYVPGHGLVPWGELTLEDHRLRIDYLEERKRRFAAGVNATVSRHKAAVAVLNESACRDLDTYVTRFGELPENLAAP